MPFQYDGCSLCSEEVFLIGNCYLHSFPPVPKEIGSNRRFMANFYQQNYPEYEA